MSNDEIRNIAVEFAYYLHVTKQCECSHEKQKEIFTEWAESKQKLDIASVSGSLPSLNKIKLKRVEGSTHCKYSVIEQKLAILYENQKKILQAIKLLGNER